MQGDRGVVLYIHQSLKPVREDNLTNSVFSESVWCSIHLSGNDKLLIGCVYRSPSSSEQNNTLLNELLESAVNLNYSHILVLGRFQLQRHRLDQK